MQGEDLGEVSEKRHLHSSCHHLPAGMFVAYEVRFSEWTLKARDDHEM